ncbi:MAG TPA: monovalent cation/H+ antiporter complex subunit F [Microthrixaceae bacterium]|jgi:multicomponent Na+:H+ antiporter subunit F|nr:monovalent cation/H+ antiporter complex subunit F [Microthrixaceae bacterium]HQF93980.1 monovalent cation/H+ antiporter complex subunit F [Microthrixaceae bacterium]
MTVVTMLVLAAAAAAYLVRLVRGPGLSERVIALDGLIVVGISAVAVHAMSTGQGAFLPVLVVITLVGFVATAAAARFIERTDGVDQRPGDAR